MVGNRPIRNEMRGRGKWTEDISDLLTKMQTGRQTLLMSVSQGFILEAAVLIDLLAFQAQSNQKKKKTFVEIDGNPSTSDNRKFLIEMKISRYKRILAEWSPSAVEE